MSRHSRRDFLETTLAAAAAAFAGVAPLAAATPACPYLQSLSETAAALVWTTLESTVSRLEFGPLEFGQQSGLTQSLTAKSRFFPADVTGLPQGFWLHTAQLSNLAPRTAYRYRTAPDHLFSHFRTPGSGRSRIVVFGDSGAETIPQKQLAARMTARQPDLILHTGDLVYPVGDADNYLRKYFGLYQELFAAAPAFPCPGNHDYYHAGGQMFVEFNKVPRDSVPAEGHGRYYSFDWENAHIVVLDSNTPLEQVAAGTGQMLEWLDQDLASSQKFWRIVMFHHPPFAGGPNQDDPLSELVRRHIVPILERHQVDLVFSGHEHNYQRTHPVGGIVYFTTGGGGADIYPPRPRREAAVQHGRHHFLEAQLEATSFAVQAIGLDGTTFDRFMLQPAPRLLGNVTSAVRGVSEVAPGGLATLMGRSLAPVEQRGDSRALRLSVNGHAATVLYANANQINFRVPTGLVGPVTLRVETANGSVECPCEIAATAPAIFEGMLFHEHGRPVTQAEPAGLGEKLSVYFTGLGTGQQVSARIGDTDVDVTLVPVPAQPGVERANFTLTNSGDFAISIDGVLSNPVQIPR